MDITEVAVLLLGVTLGWLVLFAVRRNKVQWGAFASFLTLVLGTGLLKFLYANDLLPYYGVGLFAGFFGNMVVRALGTILGGRVGEGLLEVAAFHPQAGTVRGDDTGRNPEGEGPT